jgi:hypothetical protein
LLSIFSLWQDKSEKTLEETLLYPTCRGFFTLRFFEERSQRLTRKKMIGRPEGQSMPIRQIDGTGFV